MAPWRWAAFGAICVLFGAIVPLYVAAAGEGLGKLVALPAALGLLLALCFNRIGVLLLLLLARATFELVFESSRLLIGGFEIGVGGLINGAAITIVLLLLLETPKRFSNEIVVCCGAFLAFVVAGIFTSPDRSAAVRLALQLVSNFAIFAGAFYYVQSLKNYRFCVMLIIASSVLPTLYGLSEFFGGFAGTYPEGIRVRSTFSHPNVYAFYLTVVIPLTFLALKSPHFGASRVVKAQGVVYLFILFLLLLLTKTRGAWIATALVFMGYGIFFERRYFVYLALVGLVALLVPGVADRVFDVQSSSTISSSVAQNSLEWRQALWADALSFMSPTRYVTGYGLGSFPFLATTFFKDAAGIHWSAHSVYVQLIFEMGILGLLAFLWFFLRLTYRYAGLRLSDRFGTFILLVIAAEYLVECYSDNMLDYQSFNWYVFFLFGAALALTMKVIGPKDAALTAAPSK